MSERTTIGGTTYESVGSSSSNLLLKSNGTVRVQWGGKLIDLVKNGKIASGDSSIKIAVVQDISEIKTDGVYVVNNEEQSLQLIVSKNGEQYNLTSADLYISASKKQDTTVEQRKQALENIGMYYNTLEDVQKSGIQEGIVYVLDTQTLYTIKEGIITEFEAKLKTVTVEKEKEEGENINSSVKITLSVDDKEYLLLSNDTITVHYSLQLKDSARLMSEGADDNSGYRLYMSDGMSYLDVDNINVRNGIDIPEFITVTYSQLILAIVGNSLQPHKWYMISDYQNPWKIPRNSIINNRPILVQALTTSTFYPEGQLAEDRRISIKYDVNYREFVRVVDENGAGTNDSVQTRGRITWMKDANGNEAYFDFLDYSDAQDKPLTTLHMVDDDSRTLSVFPRGSYNNKLYINDVKGTVITKNEFNNDVGGVVDFKARDTEYDYAGNALQTLGIVINMHDNTFTGSSIIIDSTCENCYNNTIKSSGVIIKANTITNTTFEDIKNTNITQNITSSSFGMVDACVFNNVFHSVKFQNLTNCWFKKGNIEQLTCRSNIDLSSPQTSMAWIDDASTITTLYNTSKIKSMYYLNNKVQITTEAEQSFVRGMIIMYSGNLGIPDGWALCDGQTYTYNGITLTTPDLRNKFIKAAYDEDAVGYVETNTTNNKITLTADNLPSHSHTYDIYESINIEAGSLLINQVLSSKKKGTAANTSTTGSAVPFSIEPNYYALLFIMKL